MKKTTAIVIGAGIGGLATAIQLAKQGIEVTIYEKNSVPGGRCQQIKKDGHIFDTGPTMYLFPQLYADFFSSIGEDPNQYFKLLQTDPTYKLNFSDNTDFVLTSDSKKMRHQLESLETGSYQKFVSYQKTAEKHYDLAINQILGLGFGNVLDSFKLPLLELLKTNALLPHYAYANRYFRHPHIKAAVTFQDSYLSLHPQEAPAIYSLFSYSELTKGNFLPQGGMYEIIKTLEKIAKKNGVKIIYNSTVKKINIEQNRASGITLKNNLVKTADILIVNTDLSFAYQNLLPKNSYSDKLQSKKYSCSALVFHWGLSKVYPQLETHNLFFSDEYHSGFDQVINQPEPPKHPHFYIQAPSRLDPTRAPKDQDTLSVMIPINHLDPSHPVDWKSYKTNVRKYVIERLKNIGLTDIESHLKFEESFLPTDWQTHLNLPFGSIYGLHHDLFQLGPFRPGRIHSKYKNVFFVGASNHPGSGLPTVLVSSRFTTQAVMKSIKKPLSNQG